MPLIVVRDGKRRLTAKEANSALVGSPALPPVLTFGEQYRRYFRPRLDKRAQRFDALFRSLQALGLSLLIVETGALRLPGNWEGDGQSTFMFDALVRESSGVLISIDIANESVDRARKACSSAAQLITNDSVLALHAVTQVVSKQIDLLHLNSFDLDPKDPLPSAIHHALELTAVRPLLGPGTVICVDDYGWLEWRQRHDRRPVPEQHLGESPAQRLSENLAARLKPRDGRSAVLPPWRKRSATALGQAKPATSPQQIARQTGPVHDRLG